jgi:cyclic pyranopterin phosphate synthase
MSELTHLGADGEVHMVDVGGKAPSQRVAIADGHIRMQPETLSALEHGDIAKGDVLGSARIAAIMAAKRTSELIPLCHPLPLSHVEVTLSLQPDIPGVHCEVRAETHGPTGVEMEALTAVQIGLLTIYDMAKALDRGMAIEAVALRHKSGGRSGEWTR